MTDIYRGRWHGKTYYYGLHYDLHAGLKDTELGKRCGEKDLAPMLKLMGPDFVQTDCKGHAGYTSWFSQVPDASVSPGVVKDALKQWRAVTRKLGLPLHCHYSGIWDKAAGEKHPEWAVTGPDGKPVGAPFGSDAGKPTNDKMCPRSDYLDKLMIPQMLELIDRYKVDGFWIDGDLWAAEPCYCPKCRTEFTRRTGIAEPPTEVSDPNWAAWWSFTLDSFEEYVTRYVQAVHDHKPGVLVCSNWLQTFRHPGAPRVPTDWISGDNAWVWGLDQSRCEARFLSTRGKPWDIMLWAFYASHGMGKPESPWVSKPPEMLQQEAAVLLAFGGNVQIYENGSGVRDGRLIPWRQKRLGEVGRFVKKRRALCQSAETLPMAAVLHSETHVRARPQGKNLMWHVDVSPVQGATYALLECQLGVDILDEWALLGRLNEFPLIVAPERDAMSEEMVEALKTYVRQGGRLLVTGAGSFERFGEEFLGARSVEVQEKKAYYVPGADGAAALFSDPWRLLECTTAKPLAPLGKSPFLDDRLLPNPCAVVNRVGKGRVAYIPANVFGNFAHNRYPLHREFIREIVQALAPKMPLRVKAPTCLDLTARRKGETAILHFVNRSSGIPNQPNNGAIDEIPPVGPVEITLPLAREPKDVRLALEDGGLDWSWTKKGAGGTLTATIDRVHIHAAVVIEP